MDELKEMSHRSHEPNSNHGMMDILVAVVGPSACDRVQLNKDVTAIG